MSDYVDIQVALRIGVGDRLQACWHFPDGQAVFGDDLLVDDLWRELKQDWSQAVRSRGASPSPGAPVSENKPQSAEGSEVWRDVVATARVDRGQATIDEFLLRAGRTLYKHLCTLRVQQCWNKYFERHNDPIRVVWDFDRDQARRLADIPFEAITCLPGDLRGVAESFALAPELSQVRRVPAAPGAGPAVPLDVEPPLRILVVASSPRDLPPQAQLDLKGGATWMQAAMGAGKDVEVVLGKPTFQELSTEGPKFHVIHFDGHGDVPGPDADARLLLETTSRDSDWRTVGEITNALLRGKTRLLVLNGCKTAAASVLASQMPAVIGMQVRVSNESATVFGHAFYAELADSGQLDIAVWKARQAIHGLPEAYRWEYRTPVLYMQSETGLLWEVRPRMLTENLSVGHRNCEYETGLEAKGGRRPFTWTALGLPIGLRLDHADRDSQATIHGTPQQSGTFPVSIRVQNRDGLEATRQFQLVVQGDGTQKDPEIVTEQIG